MESRHSPARGVLRRWVGGSHGGFMLTGGVLGCRKGGIPSHRYGESLFWGNLRQTGIDMQFKMYANGC